MSIGPHFSIPDSKRTWPNARCTGCRQDYTEHFLLRFMPDHEELRKCGRRCVKWLHLGTSPNDGLDRHSVSYQCNGVILQPDEREAMLAAHALGGFDALIVVWLDLVAQFVTWQLNASRDVKL